MSSLLPPDQSPDARHGTLSRSESIDIDVLSTSRTNWKVALALVGSTLSSAALFALSQYLTARGFVSVTLARGLLCFAWACLVILLVITINAFDPRKKRVLMVLSVGILTSMLVGLEMWASRPGRTISSDQRGDVKAIRLSTCESHDPQYVPPKGKAIRVDGFNYLSSDVICPPQGMTDEERMACLCPNRVPYTLRALPPPTTSNFETEITISKVCNPIYEVRVFLRDVYTSTGTIDASPYSPPGSKVAIGFLELAYDRHSFVIKSSAPEDEIKSRVLTATGLRVVCINQNN